jgi:autotransporter translocation and assembly factor TamB
MTGKVSGTWDMETRSNSKRSGKLIRGVKDFHLYQFHIGDMETQANLDGQNFRFPELTFHPPGIEALKTPKETLFTFDDAGFKFKGSPISGMEVEGGYIYKRENVLDIKATCRDCATAPLLAALDQPPLKGSLDGRMTMQLIMGNFDASKMDAQLDRLEVPLAEGALTQSGPLKITYHQGNFHLDQVSLAYNKGVFKLLGTYSTDKPLDLELKGDVDLSLLKAFKEQIRDASGIARADVKPKGKRDAPSLGGAIEFNQNSITLRASELHRESEGAIGDRRSKDLDSKAGGQHLRWRSHPLRNRLAGSSQDQEGRYQAEAREIAYSEPGEFKLILSGKLSLTGEEPNLLLAGTLDITEGRYVKNFDIREFILKPSQSAIPNEKSGGGFDNLKLDLSVKSPGELQIKNNIAEIDLKSDLKITGTKAKPVYEGAVEVLDGKFNYFRLNFENAKGYIDFRNPQQGHPYVDMTAQKLFERPSEDIQVAAHVTGYTDNLQLSFTSDPPLEKREILALVFTGALPEERRSISGANIASSVLASQLTSVLEQPLSGLTHLDIFRMEAPDPDSKALTSLVVGKKISERLSLEFKTDLAVDEAIKSVQAEYLIFDNVLLKASRSTTSKYRLELTFRFRGY